MAASPSRFQSARDTIDHAESRINDFKAKWQAFAHSYPYTQRMDVDVERGHDVWKIVQSKPAPTKRFVGIATDALGALRSALDQAGHAAARLAGNRGKNAHFPFGRTEADARAKALPPKGRSRDIPKEIFELMLSFKPYEGGDSTLLALNQLRNTPTHEVALRVEPRVFGVDGNISVSTIAEVTWPPEWDSKKREMVIARVPNGAQPNYDLRIAGFVEFDEPVDAVRGRPVATVLDEMRVRVTRIVDAIEAMAGGFGPL